MKLKFKPLTVYYVVFLFAVALLILGVAWAFAQTPTPRTLITIATALGCIAVAAAWGEVQYLRGMRLYAEADTDECGDGTTGADDDDDDDDDDATTLTEFIEEYTDWTRETFGPHPRTAGVIEHARRELAEIEASGGRDVTEWTDLAFLAMDGARRHGFTPGQIAWAWHAKFAVNRARTWPDWRAVGADTPIEHVRKGR
jgi:hypothetical protein